MALTCNGNGEITLQEIINAINAQDTTISQLKLDDLSNVSAPSPNDKDIIMFDATLDAWTTGSQPSSQIPSDWNQTDGTQVDYIKNKPDLSQYENDLGAPASDGQILSSDVSGNRVWIDNISSVNLEFVSMANNGTITNDSGNDALISQASHVYAGLMSADDKSNLDALWILIDGGTF